MEIKKEKDIKRRLKLKETLRRLKDSSGLKELKKIELHKPIVKASKKTWGWLDGKKTIFGVLITSAGIGMSYIPLTSAFSGEVIKTGIVTLITGIGFKIKKNDKIVNFLVKIIKNRGKK